MWEITRDTTVVAAWHSWEDEPWTMEALRDVQRDMEMPKEYIEKNWTLECYKNKIYTCLEPKPVIERINFINQLLLFQKHLARIEITVSKTKHYEVIKDELLALCEEDDIVGFKVVKFRKKHSMSKDTEQTYWIVIRLPKPSIDAVKTKAATYLLLDMIHRLQGLDHYREKEAKDSYPLMSKLYRYYRLERYDSENLDSIIRASKRLNSSSVSELEDHVGKLSIKTPSATV